MSWVWPTSAVVKPLLALPISQKLVPGSSHGDKQATLSHNTPFEVYTLNLQANVDESPFGLTSNSSWQAWVAFSFKKFDDLFTIITADSQYRLRPSLLWDVFNIDSDSWYQMIYYYFWSRPVWTLSGQTRQFLVTHGWTLLSFAYQKVSLNKNKTTHFHPLPPFLLPTSYFLLSLPQILRIFLVCTVQSLKVFK